jgi:hypothetical protein
MVERSRQNAEVFRGDGVAAAAGLPGAEEGGEGGAEEFSEFEQPVVASENASAVAAARVRVGGAVTG